MEPTNDVARKAVKLIVKLLKFESNLTWTYEKAETVWRLAPAGSDTKAPPKYRLRMAPFEGTSEPFEICISDYDLRDGFLAHVAQVLYEKRRLLTTRLPEEPAGESTPDAHGENVPTEGPQDTKGADDTETPEDTAKREDTNTPEDPQGLKTRTLDVRDSVVGSPTAPGARGRSAAA